jgi:hypothetical protein
MTKDASAQATPSRPYPADKARSGEIILRTPLQRWVFIAASPEQCCWCSR